MDARRFDRLAAALAGDRRGVLRAGAGAAAAALLRSAPTRAAKCGHGGAICTADAQCCNNSCVKAPGEPVGQCACKPLGAKCGGNHDCCTGNCKKKHGKNKGTCACLLQEFCRFPEPVGSCCDTIDAKEECTECGCCPPGNTKCCIGRTLGPFCVFDNGSCCGDKSCLPTWGCCTSGKQDICCPPLEACCVFMDRTFCCPVGQHCCGDHCCAG